MMTEVMTIVTFSETHFMIQHIFTVSFTILWWCLVAWKLFSRYHSYCVYR